MSDLDYWNEWFARCKWENNLRISILQNRFGYSLAEIEYNKRVKSSHRFSLLSCLHEVRLKIMQYNRHLIWVTMNLLVISQWLKTIRLSYELILVNLCFRSYLQLILRIHLLASHCFLLWFYPELNKLSTLILRYVKLGLYEFLRKSCCLKNRITT